MIPDELLYLILKNIFLKQLLVRKPEQKIPWPKFLSLLYKQAKDQSNQVGTGKRAYSSYKSNYHQAKY